MSCAQGVAYGAQTARGVPQFGQSNGELVLWGAMDIASKLGTLQVSQLYSAHRTLTFFQVGAMYGLR